MEQIIQELKEHLITELNLEDLTPEDIDAEAPLFGDGLGLDSIDALEIILILEAIVAVFLFAELLLLFKRCVTRISNNK